MEARRPGRGGGRRRSSDLSERGFEELTCRGVTRCARDASRGTSVAPHSERPGNDCFGHTGLRRPRIGLPTLSHQTLPFACVQPYVTTGGAGPPEMLVGRSAETDDPENERHAFFVDLKPHGMGISRDTRLNLVRRAGLI